MTWIHFDFNCYFFNARFVCLPKSRGMKKLTAVEKSWELSGRNQNIISKLESKIQKLVCLNKDALKKRTDFEQMLIKLVGWLMADASDAVLDAVVMLTLLLNGAQRAAAVNSDLAHYYSWQCFVFFMKELIAGALSCEWHGIPLSSKSKRPFQKWALMARV